MNKKRPVNLDLASLKYPPMAITSILHRISGILIFLLLPIMLFLLAKSLHSPQTFVEFTRMLSQPFYKLIVWAFSSALLYHILAGIRHMIMDLGFGEHLSSARNSSMLIIGLGVISIIFLGIWIW